MSGPKGANVLVDGGAFRRSLTSIDVGYNNIKKEATLELVRIFKSNENVQAMLDQAWIDQDRSGTLDLKELKALFTVIWHQFGEDTCFELLRRIRKTGY